MKFLNHDRHHAGDAEMPDEPTCRREETARASTGASRRQLMHAAHTSLLAAVVYATTLSDRFELATAFDPEQLDGIPPGVLLHLEAVSDAFQEGARHTMFFIEPELARGAQRIAALARDGAGEPSTGAAR
jgi:hypothetical protein